MKNLKLTDQQIKIVIDGLYGRIRYKGVRELLHNIHEQLQEQKKLTDTE